MEYNVGMLSVRPKGRCLRPRVRKEEEFLGQRALFPPARGLGEHCKLPHWVRAEPRKILNLVHFGN